MTQRIAVFLPNWIGDAVMATPALRAIRQTYSEATITSIHRPVIGAVLEGTDLVDQSIVTDPRNRSHELSGIALIRKLRESRFDLAVLFPNSVRTAWLAFAGGARRRVGMARDGRRWLLTDPVTPKSRSTPNPVIDEYRRLAESAGAACSDRQMVLATTNRDRELYERFRGIHPHLASKPTVCLNPGGAFGAAKHWPVESFGILAHRIASTYDVAVVVLCGPAERLQAEAICRTADHPSVIGLHQTQPSVGLTKAAIESSQLLVTTDSGPRHFAAPFDVPVIALYGPTHIAWSDTFYEKGVNLQIKLDCGPCQQRVCPLGHLDCMKKLSVDQVFSEVQRLIDLPENDRSWVA